MTQNENYSRLLAAHVDLEAGRYDAARAQFEELGALGDEQALMYLGSMHERGLGGSINEAAAAACYRKSCDAGNATSCFFLGLLNFRNGDFASALEPYRTAADAGHPAAAYWIAQIYGDVTNPGADQVKQAHYLEIAVRSGHAFAARDLAKARMRSSASIISKVRACGQYLVAIIRGIIIIAGNAEDPRVQ